MARAQPTINIDYRYRSFRYRITERVLIKLKRLNFFGQYIIVITDGITGPRLMKLKTRYAILSWLRIINLEHAILSPMFNKEKSPALAIYITIINRVLQAGKLNFERGQKRSKMTFLSVFSHFQLSMLQLAQP